MSSIQNVKENENKSWKICQIITEGLPDIALIQDEKSLKYSIAKIIPTDSALLLTRFEAEASIHRELNHSKILKFEEFHEHLHLTDFEGNETIVVVIRTEHAPRGDLFELLCDFSIMPYFIACSYAKQIVEAVAYLHEKGVAHRDIKLENFLLDYDFGVKLANFEFSCKTDKEEKILEKVEVYQYSAPEQLENAYCNGFETDIFSLGLAIFILVAGRMPFEKATKDDEFYVHFINQEEDKFWDKHEELVVSRSKEQFFRQDFRECINGMLKYKSSSRMTIKEVISQPWLDVSPTAFEKCGEIVKEFLKKKKKLNF